MEKNRNEYSRKRLNSLVLLVAFTAIMLIVSTYAWFSAQKNVTVGGLKGKVNVAEGLQISLDAAHWVNTIDFSHFEQTSADSWTIKPDSPTKYFDGASFQAPIDGVTNVTPEELLPVSTTGFKATNDGIGQPALKFYSGTNEDTTKLLSDINVVEENKKAGYFAFDLFLMNTTKGEEPDKLLLDPNADVLGNNELAGVQNTARVGFALYENTNEGMAITGENVLSATEIIAGTSTGKNIKDLAIWEPNANAHTEQIIKSKANSLKLTAADIAEFSLAEADGKTKVSAFTAEQKLPTYGLTSESIAGKSEDAAVVHIPDVYNWGDVPAKGVKRQYTLQTEAVTQTGGPETIKGVRPEPVALVSTGKCETAGKLTETESSFTIAANQYQKIRVYVWMEGQDPDCINSASLGGGLTIDIGFSKPGTAKE